MHQLDWCLHVSQAFGAVEPRHFCLFEFRVLFGVTASESNVENIEQVSMEPFVFGAEAETLFQVWALVLIVLHDAAYSTWPQGLFASVLHSFNRESASPFIIVLSFKFPLSPKSSSLSPN